MLGGRIITAVLIPVPARCVEHCPSRKYCRQVLEHCTAGQQGSYSTTALLVVWRPSEVPLQHPLFCVASRAQLVRLPSLEWRWLRQYKSKVRAEPRSLEATQYGLAGTAHSRGQRTRSCTEMPVTCVCTSMGTTCGYLHIYGKTLRYTATPRHFSPWIVKSIRPLPTTEKMLNTLSEEAPPETSDIEIKRYRRP